LHVSVDWESLPVVRDPKIYEAKSYGTYSKSKSKHIQMIETISIIEIGVIQFWWWRRSYQWNKEIVGQEVYSNDDAYEKALVNDRKLLKEAKKAKKVSVYWWTWWWINWVGNIKEEDNFIIGVFQSSILIIID
jgi:hypothetical protein